MSAEDISTDSSHHSGAYSEDSSVVQVQKMPGLKHLPSWPPVNIDFQDVSFTVPDLIEGMCLVSLIFLL